MAKFKHSLTFIYISTTEDRASSIWSSCGQVQEPLKVICVSREVKRQASYPQVDNVRNFLACKSMDPLEAQARTKHLKLDF